MNTPTSLDYKYQADRAYVMRCALSDIENMQHFTLTANVMRGEIARVMGEMEVALQAVKPTAKELS